MHPESNLPPIPPWFTEAVLLLIAKYPGAQTGRATVAAYWHELHPFAEPAIRWALKRAPQTADNKAFPPSAPMVLEHAKAWREPTKVDLSRPALPEPVPEIDPAIRSEFEHITSQVRTGELDGPGAAKAYIRAIARGLE